MSFGITLLFTAWIVASAFIQACNHPLKKWVSPALTGLCALIVIYGAAVGNIPDRLGFVLGGALLLLAGSDFCFERSGESPELFPLAMIFGVVSGLIIGVAINLEAVRAGLPLLLLAGFLMIGIAASTFVYSVLEVKAALRMPVYVYLIQAVILLAGGLGCLAMELYPLAVWGIFLFASDSLVGIRAFPSPSRPLPWLTPNRILLGILMLYYTAQFALVGWAV